MKSENIICFKIQNIPIFIIHCLNSIRITGFPALCSSTLSGWDDLDILDFARTADIYDLPGWMELLCSKLATEEELSGEKVAEMIIAGSRYQDSAARTLREVARDKIKERREMMDDPVFRERLREDHNCVVEFIKFII